MTNLNDIFRTKGNEVYSVKPDDSALDAIRLMNEKGIGAVLVLDGDQLAGVLSERDIARKITLVDKPAKDTLAREIMTPRVVSCSPGMTVQEAMALMTDKRIRHLPVLDEGRIVGVVSIGDLVKAIIDDQKFVIRQLEQYISS